MPLPASPLVRSIFPFLLALGVACPLSAQDEEGDVQAGALRVGISYLDITGRHEDAPAMELGYRPERPALGPLSSDVGILVGWDGTLFGFVGTRLPLSPFDWLVLAPTFGAGLYRAGEGIELGSPVEFRSGLEVGLRFSGNSAILLNFYHLSNAGISDRNPGVEVLGLGYSLSW